MDEGMRMERASELKTDEKKKGVKDNFYLFIFSVKFNKEVASKV